MDWLVASLIAAAIVGVGLVVYLAVRVLPSPVSSDGQSAESYAEELRSGATSTEKSQGFVGLLSLGVVAIHTIVNKGQSYDDAKQGQVFRSGLTPEHVSALMQVEGRGR